MINNLQWPSLEKKRRNNRLTLLYKIANEDVAINKEKRLIPTKRRSRHLNNNAFTIPYSATTYRQLSFFPRTIKEWNSLPPDITSAGSVECFKAQLAKHFL